MELDDFKSAWARYDKKLTEKLKFNEDLLRKMNLNTSKREMQKPFIYELGNIFVLFLVFIYAISASIRLINEPKFYIPGFIAALICIIGLVTTIMKVNKFANIDYYGAPILKIQKDITLLNRFVLKARKHELGLLPILMICLIPLLFKSVHNIDIYQNIKLFIIEIVIILGISYPATIWINKHLYDRKFKNAERLLAELERFEKEELNENVDI